MKKLISLILCCLICGITSAQLIKQKVEKQKKQSCYGKLFLFDN